MLGRELWVGAPVVVCGGKELRTRMSSPPVPVDVTFCDPRLEDQCWAEFAVSCVDAGIGLWVGVPLVCGGKELWTRMSCPTCTCLM